MLLDSGTGQSKDFRRCACCGKDGFLCATLIAERTNLNAPSAGFRRQAGDNGFGINAAGLFDFIGVVLLGHQKLGISRKNFAIRADARTWRDDFAVFFQFKIGLIKKLLHLVIA